MLLAVTSFAAGVAGINITGHVTDSSNGKHIPYATVAIVGTTLGTAADGTGHFNLKNIEAGEYIIEATFVGYSPVQKKISVDSSTKSLELTFNLDEDLMSVDQVVVSSTRSATLRRNSPNLVSMLSSELFETVNATTLADGLPFQSGVRVEDNCQNCGFTQVRINGLDGHYSQIMVDSRPTFSALTGVYGLEQIPANMIDRVEIVRGGGSALYGSSAIGGTINIITKNPEYNSSEFAHTLSVAGNGYTDNNTTANASVVTDNQRGGISLFAQVRERTGYDANGDGFTEIPELSSQTFGMRSFLRTSDFSRLTMQFDASKEYRRGGDNLDLPAHNAEVEIAEMIDHNIINFGLGFDIFSHDYKRSLNLYTTAQSTTRDSYYGGGGLSAYGTTTEFLWVSGAQLSQKWDNLLFMPAQLIWGVEYNHNDLNDSYLEQDWDPIAQRVNVASTYLQNEWSNDKWGILLGGRMDYTDYNLDKVIFSPRANLRFNPTRDINLRATYSTGFRAPQAFDEDLHISINGGDLIKSTFADDLKEETSQSVSLSADFYHKFGNVSTNLLIEGFYTCLTDVFVNTYTYYDAEGNIVGDEDEYATIVDERSNGASATIKGITVEAKAAFPSSLQLQVGATYQSSLYSESRSWSSSSDENERMFRTPDLYGYFTASYDPSATWSVALTGTYTGSMLVEHCEGYIAADTTETTPDFWDVNLKVSHNFTINKSVRAQLHAGVSNIFNQYQSDFDKGGLRDAGYVYGPMLPRNVNCGVKLMF